jgi:hypothetical protein
MRAANYANHNGPSTLHSFAEKTMDRTTYVLLDLQPSVEASVHAARPRSPDGDHLELDFDRAGIFGER